MGTVRKVFMEIIANISVLSGISASRERAFYVPTSVVCDKDVNLLYKAPAYLNNININSSISGWIKGITKYPYEG